jgi:uncharacterized protein (TIGR01777 family)
MTTTPGKVLFSGATGVIGSALVRAAQADRIQGVQLVRHRPTGPSEIQWSPDAPVPVSDSAPLEGIGAAIHLSGANLSSHRWTADYKHQIVQSRVQSTRALVNTLKSLKQRPSVLLCASATGIYGNRGGEILTEESNPGRGFIVDTCLAWEAEAAQARALGIRVVHLRFGVVLSPQGGALKHMLPLFRLGLGGNLGNGRQWMNWIALSDAVRAIFHLVDSAIDGPANLVAPNPVTNAEFTRALGRALHRPAIIPAPAFALRLALGEMTDEVLLASTRAIPDRLLGSGFTFDLPNIASALNGVLHPTP